MKNRKWILCKKSEEVQSLLEQWAKEHELLKAGECLKFEMRIEKLPPMVTGKAFVLEDKTVGAVWRLAVNAKASAKFHYVKPAELKVTEIGHLLALFSGDYRRILEFLLINRKNFPTQQAEITKALGIEGPTGPEHIYDSDVDKMNKRIRQVYPYLRLANAKEPLRSSVGWFLQLWVIEPKK